MRHRRHVADRLDRDVRRAHDDARLQRECHIVHAEVDGAAKRPSVPHETVRIEVELGTAVGSGFQSATLDG